MDRTTTSRAIVGAALTVLLGSFAVVPAVAAPVDPAPPVVAATWTVKGFFKSVKENGVWNTRKGGSTVPLKFVILDESNVKSKDKADIASFVAAPIPCVGQTAAVGTTTIDFLSVTKKGRSLRSHHGAFHQNWKTDKVKATTMTVPAKAKGHGKAKTKKVIVPSCYQVTMTAADGQSLTALFKLK
ncbi:MAG: PxKF domain-containing protein [Propionicimonas sp.]